MRVAERVSRALITFGGLGTVVAVSTIFLFLLVVVVPLFRGAEVDPPQRLPAEAPASRIVALGSDEYGLLLWSVHADGTLQVRAAEDGALLEERGLSPAPGPTAVCMPADGVAGALGFADGSVRPVSVGFATALLEPAAVPAVLADLAPGARRTHEGGVAQRLPTGEVRVQRLRVRLGEPIASGQAQVLRIDRADVGDAMVVASMHADGRVALLRVTEKLNPMDPDAPPVRRSERVELPGGRRPAGVPLACGVPGTADGVYLLWEDGLTLRYDCRNLDAPVLAETTDLVEEAGVAVSALGWLLGKGTLLVGTTSGEVRCWSRAQPSVDPPSTTDLALLVPNHVFPPEGGRSAVTALASSLRSRQFLAGSADGRIVLRNATGEKELAEVREDEGPVLALGFAPKEDAFLARTPRALVRRGLRVGHPEASPKALFGKVWYEGFEKPEYVWQSAGATDDFESKFSLTPLVFGTLKATFFSMLFGVPIALLAAVFTSEFLGARLRTSVKSVIEMMASLPSVVLGFLAAIVIAPFVQSVVPTVLTWFVVLPLLLLVGAHLWQLLPQHVALRLSGVPRSLVMVLLFPLSVVLAGAAAPAVERSLFRGDLLAWLDHTVSEPELAAAAWAPGAQLPPEERAALTARAKEEALGKRPPPGQPPLLTSGQAQAVRAAHHENAIGGWVYLTFPVAAVLVLLGMGWWLNPWLRGRSTDWSRAACARVALFKFVGGSLLAVGVAWGLAYVLTRLGLDPRGDATYATRGEGAILGGYVQRNALVVGFVMGFAIIPIIYTLAEDALSGVPQHLRLASLAAGATPWQTAVRVIIPTAMSGLFSAVMIGLGRAVGETMIVLMATGNTPVMEWNIHNGFRTLSANIAVEMSEAHEGGTHYRVLFLAAFVLFGITFVLNTLAESVRQRFRKRAYQL